MDELVLSKYLYVREDDTSFLITHLLNGITIRVKRDLVNLIDRFNKPTLPACFEKEYIDSNYDETISMLKNIHFLNSAQDEDITEVLKKWKNIFNKNEHDYSFKDIELTYYSRAKEPVNMFPKEIANICSEISLELFSFKNKVYVCFLSQIEYDEIVKLYNIPKNVKAFVDSKIVLILNYEMFFDKNNSDLFYPTVRHEVTHLLLSQYNYSMPFWFEEGICEIYSRRSTTEYINVILKNKDLISFVELNKEALGDIPQLSIFHDNGLMFYNQAQSFVDYIYNRVGSHVFWEILNRTSIYQEFTQRIKEITGISLQQYEANWVNYIKLDSDTVKDM